MNLWCPLKMVYPFLESRKALDLLEDARCKIATEEVSPVTPGGQRKARDQIDAGLAEKREATSQLVSTYR